MSIRVAAVTDAIQDENKNLVPSVHDHRVKIQKAMNRNRRHINYRVKKVGPGKYKAESGKICTNIALGCFGAEYFSFDITIDKKSVIVRSTVPGGGFFSGGFIGMNKNHDETNAVRRRLHEAFPRRSINGKQV